MITLQHSPDPKPDDQLEQKESIFRRYMPNLQFVVPYAMGVLLTAGPGLILSLFGLLYPIGYFGGMMAGVLVMVVISALMSRPRADDEAEEPLMSKCPFCGERAGHIDEWGKTHCNGCGASIGQQLETIIAQQHRRRHG